VQNTITALQSIQLVLDSALNLTGYGDTGLEGLESDMDQLTGIMTESEAILWNVHSLEQQVAFLFGLDTAPDSTRALRERLYEIRRYQFEQQMAARRIQTLQATAIDTVKRIIRLWERILDVLGEKQSAQVLQSQLTQLQYLHQKQTVTLAAYQQAQLAEMQQEPLIDESLERINDQLLSDWPGQ
jgi:hypothetical protein